MGPKRSLETNFSKMAIFPPGDKRFWPASYRITVKNKPQGIICQGPQRFFDEHCGRYKLFSPGHKRLLKEPILEK